MVIRLIFFFGKWLIHIVLTYTTNLEYFSQHAIDKYWPVFQSQVYFGRLFFRFGDGSAFIKHFAIASSVAMISAEGKQSKNH
jgi:hypothetical protein